MSSFGLPPPTSKTPSLPPAVIFQHPGRIWQLALCNAWESLQQVGQVWQPLPRILVASIPDRIEAILQDRPASFAVLSTKSLHYQACLQRLPDWTQRHPLATFCVINNSGIDLKPALWELGVRCVVRSTWETEILARWLAWHLRRLDEPPDQWLQEVWDRLPWPRWSGTGLVSG